MKAHLLYRNRDFKLPATLPWNAEDLNRDLELTILFNAMAQNDEFLFQVAETVVQTGCGRDLDTIHYRQAILQDCLNQAATVRKFYALAVEASAKAKKHYLGSSPNHPDWALHRSIGHMESFLGLIQDLRRLADLNINKFTSEGWRTLLQVLRRELSDDYLSSIKYHLEQLKFRNGILLSAELGNGNRGSRYRLHRPPSSGRETLFLPHFKWLNKLFSERQPETYSFSLDPRDEAGARALAELTNRGISLAATALAKSRDHVQSFFASFQAELAFYIGCLNLHEQLTQKGGSLCFATPLAITEHQLSFQGLYDPALSLSMKQDVVTNDVVADGKDLIIITGANQGGKSTFLRSIGLAQLMMQCGMFVAADTFCASLCDGLFSHYKREEDLAMESGKLDEELQRMSIIIDSLTPDSILLLNESFAATNEREGSEIARQIISALVEKQIRVICVTHLYELARGFHEVASEKFLFLRAEREKDGTRTFKLIEGEPFPTSFGDDLYRRIFGDKGD